MFHRNSPLPCILVNSLPESSAIQKISVILAFRNTGEPFECYYSTVNSILRIAISLLLKEIILFLYQTYVNCLWKRETDLKKC